MKKLAFLSLTFFLAFSVVKAQNGKTEKVTVPGAGEELNIERTPLITLEGTTVNAISKENFEIDFVNTSDVKWKRTTNFDEVSFMQNGRMLTGYYDSEGILVGTTESKKLSDIPLNAVKEIKGKYMGYTIGPVVYFSDNAENKSDMILWSKQFKGQDLYFVQLSKAGNQIILTVSKSGQVSVFKQL